MNKTMLKIAIIPVLLALPIIMLTTSKKVLAEGCATGGYTDEDRDGDGILNDGSDKCPDDCGENTPDGCPAATPDPVLPDEGDEDGDGVINGDEQCLGTSVEEGGNVDEYGCPVAAEDPSSMDTDGDKTSDANDPCPEDPLNMCKTGNVYNTDTTKDTTTASTGKTTLESPYGGETAAKNPAQIVAVILQALLGIVGACTLLMFIWGGLRMIFSEGNEEKITKSRSILVWATIGLAVIMVSYSILSYVFTIIQSSATGTI
ncbi:MAG: pilin [Patescibacteria group bacterium]|jgi:hypothetical protein